MTKLIGKLLMAALLLMSLPSCSGMFGPIINNTAPAPWFPSCVTVCDALRPAAPPAVSNDWLHSDNVMLKLREEQPSDSQEKFAPCKCDFLKGGVNGKL